MHGAFTKQSLHSVGIPVTVLSTLSQFASGGPLAAKRTIHGSHTWSGGPSTATQFAADGPGGPVMAGDQLWHDSTLDFGKLTKMSHLADSILLAQLITKPIHYPCTVA